MEYYDKQLLKASKLGELEQVRSSLEQGASVHCQDKNDNSYSPLHHSVTAGHLEVVAYLLRQGANLEQVDGNNRTVLQLALFQSCPGGTDINHKLISLLQRYGASFESAIFEQVYRGQLDLLHGKVTSSEINQTDTQGYSVLHYACAGGSLGMVQALVAQGAEMSLRSQDGNTPLLVAATWGRMNIVQWLLWLLKQKSSSPARKGNGGEAALLKAAEGGHLEVVQWLVDQGVAVPEEDNNGDTALLKS